MRRDDLAALALAIDPDRAPGLLARYEVWGEARAEAAGLAAAIVAAYPAFAPLAEARPDLFADLVREGWRSRRDRSTYESLLFAAAGDLTDGIGVRAGLRRRVQYEKLRIAARELLPSALFGADVDTTYVEIADLADAAIEVALAEAESHISARFGVPLTARGEPSAFVVLGMGKLGGRELNAGSDVDLIYLYDTDDGETEPPQGGEPLTLHEYWSRVARRLTASLEISTAEGTIWRVDLRLRPEGSQGPIANSVPAAERYYETFGRLWERAALVRARPSAGDLELGRGALEELSPFIYKRNVDPAIAKEMIRLIEQSRAELSERPDLDLKLGPGGIREAEFFVQSLQLIWGGQEARVRATGTLDALARLRGRGLVTDRESREVADAYVLFRRLEHRIQWATGLQTHLLPSAPEDKQRLARSLGYTGQEHLERELVKARAAVASRLASLLPKGVSLSVEPSRWDEIIRKLDDPDPRGLEDAIARAFGPVATSELRRDIAQLARRPDDLLGGITRERFPELAMTFLDALVDAADPEQAARFFRTWLSRLSAPGIYVRPLGEDPRALRRLVAAFGASAFIGSAIANRPELGDSLVWSRRVPNPELARIEVEREVGEINQWEATADPEPFVGALRRAKARTTIEVALADLGGEIGTREVTLTLSALADATLEHATRFALGAAGAVRGLAVIAVGKLGGNEIGYGSDLDVLFIFDPLAAPEGSDPSQFFERKARRVIQLVSTAHPEGTGYELDTRLRPSGSHGLLVTSLSAFARYHAVPLDELPMGDGLSVLHSGAPWERQALIRARFAAGDKALGATAMHVAHVAAYERGAPHPDELHRLRTRLERELARERPGRYDLKLGRGGLADIEFAVQYLQMKNGRDQRVRTAETPVALDVLRQLGVLRPGVHAIFREGYRFLRRLEQRIRIVHGSSVSLLDENAEGLVPLARRMGIRSSPRSDPSRELVARYRDVTAAVRTAYLEVIAVEEPMSDSLEPVT